MASNSGVNPKDKAQCFTKVHDYAQKAAQRIIQGDNYESDAEEGSLTAKLNAPTTSPEAHDELKKVKKAKDVTEEEVDDEDPEALKKPKGAKLTSEKVAKAVSDDPRYLGNRKRRKAKQQKLLDKFVRKENTSYGYTEGKDHVVDTTTESNSNDAMLRTQYQSDDDGADELNLDENGDIIQDDKGQPTRVLRKANGAAAQKGPNKTRKRTTKIPRASSAVGHETSGHVRTAQPEAIQIQEACIRQ